MEHQEYVTARHARLVEHAIELGWPTDDAPTIVDEVLEAQRKVIARSDDPDPAVREALARRVAGRPEPRSRLWTLIAVVTVAILAVGLGWGWRQQPDARVPSVFAYDVDTATDALEDAGYRVTVETADACEPRGLALGSQPPAGSVHDRGEEVLLRSAIPAGPSCLSIYGFRSDAWEFVAFVRGGAAPPFARQVRVYVDGVLAARLDDGAASDRASWDGVLAPLEAVSSGLAPTANGMPRIVVDSLVPPAALCGVENPAALADRIALRVSVDPSPDGDEALCPVTADLYDDDLNLIEAVSLYSGTSRDRGTG